MSFSMLYNTHGQFGDGESDCIDIYLLIPIRTPPEKVQLTLQSSYPKRFLRRYIGNHNTIFCEVLCSTKLFRDLGNKWNRLNSDLVKAIQKKLTLNWPTCGKLTHVENPVICTPLFLRKPWVFPMTLSLS